MSYEDGMDALRTCIKDAKSDDWELKVAGQCVQIIKPDAYENGVLELGTEVISSINVRITCFLGASPGVSTSVYSMLEVLKKAFSEVVVSEKGKALLNDIVPSWNVMVMRKIFEKNLARSKASLKL